MRKSLMLVVGLVIGLSWIIHVQAQVKLSGGAQQSPYIVSTLGTPATNTERLVTDGANSSDCTVGGGSTRVKCIYNGSAWAAIGGSGGSGGLVDTLVPTKTSSTLSVSSGLFRVGDNVISVAAATAVITAGSGSGSAMAYITQAGVIVVEHSTAAGLTIVCTNCTATQVTTPAVPATAVKLADVVITSGAWGTLTDRRALYGRDVIVAGTGVILTPGSGINTIAIDTADVARQGGTNTFTGANDFSGATSTYPMKVGTSDPGTCSVGMFLFRSDTGATKVCTTTNTWTAIGGGGGAAAVYVDMPAGGCTHGAATREMWWDAGALVCIDATNNVGFIGVYQNAPLGTAHMIIPYGWTSGTIDITLPVVEGSSAGLSHTMTVATACPGTGDLRAITFGATQTISWTSTATNTTQYVTKTGVTVPGTCAAGQPMLFQFIRTDTAGAYTYFLGAVAKVNIP